MRAKMKSRTPAATSRKILRSSAATKPSKIFRRKTDLPWKEVSQEILSKKSSAEKNSSLLYRRKSDLVLVHELSDNDLIVVIHTQNREAYKELFARYQKKLFTYIYHLVGNKEETEDILQNVFSKTYKSIAHFDTSRKFSSWIYRIAHNEAVNFLKRKSKRYTVSWEDITTSKDKLDSASGEELPEDMLEHKEIVKEVDSAIEKIPLKYQEVLKMRYFKEYSYEEMAKILGKPLNTVGTLINRAKKKLLEVVNEEMRNKAK
jgi:RNA polymerase sigma-70 factor (ECF subfamily)